MRILVVAAFLGLACADVSHLPQAYLSSHHHEHNHEQHHHGGYSYKTPHSGFRSQSQHSAVSHVAETRNVPQFAAQIQQSLQAPVASPVFSSVAKTRQIPQYAAPIQHSAPVKSSYFSSSGAETRQIPQYSAAVSHSVPALVQPSYSTSTAETIRIPQYAAPIQHSAPVQSSSFSSSGAETRQIPQYSAPIPNSNAALVQPSYSTSAAETRQIPQYSAPIQHASAPVLSSSSSAAETVQIPDYASPVQVQSFAQAAESQRVQQFEAPRSAPTYNQREFRGPQTFNQAETQVISQFVSPGLQAQPFISAPAPSFPIAPNFQTRASEVALDIIVPSKQAESDYQAQATSISGNNGLLNNDGYHY